MGAGGKRSWRVVVVVVVDVVVNLNRLDQGERRQV